MRKLFWLQNKPTNELNQLLDTVHQHHPDVIVLSSDADLNNARPLHHAKGLLGHTLNAIVLDARLGFPLDYFLCSANTIQKNGTFFLIWSPDNNDEQSTRFHTEQIPTDHFQAFLARGLALFSLPFSLHHYSSFTPTHHVDPSLNTEQQQILATLTTHEKGVITLFAPRGTGKSSVTAEFLRNIGHQYIITAPNQTALKSYVNVKLNFMAPDYLFLNHTKLNQEWLIVEEAAQMPIAHLEKLSQLTDRVLLISSIENYEGTGKGLEKKLADIIPIHQSLTLTERQRFTQQDPLSKFCDDISLNLVDSRLESQPKPLSLTITEPNENSALNHHCDLYDANTLHQFQQNSALVASFYQFMNAYHYQTNAQDIRRLFDSPNQVLMTCSHYNALIGGIWAIKEGSLPAALAEEVFNGYRRPKGNLVVQTLSAHGYYPELMTLKSLRISRIAVDKNHRQQGIAKEMIQKLIQHAKHNSYDFISTSFGLTEALLQFWQQCGFTWVHLGSHRDKTTGLHASIMLFPLSQQMKTKVIQMQQKRQNDAYHLQHAPFIHPNIHHLLFNKSVKGDFDQLDEAVLGAHIQHKKPKEAVFSAKMRLNLLNSLNEN